MFFPGRFILVESVILWIHIDAICIKLSIFQETWFNGNYEATDLGYCDCKIDSQAWDDGSLNCVESHLVFYLGMIFIFGIGLGTIINIGLMIRRRMNRKTEQEQQQNQDIDTTSA